jgi:hypothetical protein
MFNGPYMITDVTHNITPGTFQTSFTGVRQGIFDLPSIDNYLQSINVNLLTELQRVIKSRKEETPKTRTDSASNTPTGNGNTTPAEPNTCVGLVIPTYSSDGYVVKTNSSGTTKNISDIVTSIKNATPFDNLQSIIYAICYVESFKDNKFNGYENNFTTKINLTRDFGETSGSFLKEYSCVNSDNVSLPSANFETIDDFMYFMVSRLQENVSRITSVGLYKYYNCNWPTSENNLTYEQFDLKKDDGVYVNIREKLRDGLKSARVGGINVGPDDNAINLLISGTTTSGQNTNNPQNNQNTTTTSQPTCPIPTISSITPLTGESGNSATVTINGACLYNVQTVTVNGQSCGFTFINNNQIIVVIPANLTGTITITTGHGTVTSTQIFQFLTTTNISNGTGGVVVPPGSNPAAPTYNNIQFKLITTPDSQVLIGNDRNYFNVLKSDGRYAVLQITDPYFSYDKVEYVLAYNTTNNAVPFSYEHGGYTNNTELCNVNNRASGTYHFVLTYRPNGAGQEPSITINSDSWTQ